MYYIVYGSLYVFSLLPLRILYLFSDFAFFLMYYVFGYRKKIVMDNLRHAFPEKNEKERKDIARKFYRNLTDTFLESIKLISISKRGIQKHIDADLSVIERLHREGRKCQEHLGHNFNWELASFAFG
jgi:KDO2-lipid IV(A) lauroyltransferase